MKILYFTNIPAPYRVECFNLIKKNNQVDILFDVTQEKTRNKNWFKDNNYEFNFKNLRKFAPITLFKEIKKNSYDIIVIGTYASINGAILNLMLKIMKKPFIINADGGFIPEKESIFSAFLKKFFLSKASYYISTGKETNKYLVHYGAKEENIFIYPFSSVLDSDVLSKPLSYTEKKKLRVKSGYNYKRLFVSVGSFIDRKGYDITIEAIGLNKNMFKDAGFLIIGGGEEKEHYKELIKKYDLSNIHLIDFCSKKEIFNYYKMSDVFFFPSRYDIWGLVLNEAMACGLPSIASDNVLSAKELLEKNDIYQCFDRKKQAIILKKYADMSNLELEKMGIKNLNVIKNYTIEKMAESHIEIFNEVIKRNDIYE